MRSIRLTFAAVILSAVGLFAFTSKKIGDTKNEKSFAITYYSFNGTSTSQYTDSTKWSRHVSPPALTCSGSAMACKVESNTLTTRTQLVNFIQTNGGAISGAAIVTAKKN